MKLLVQWTQSNPNDWVEIDSSEWASLPKRPEPKGGEGIDDSPGWIYGVNVMGTVFIGNDHIAIEDINDTDIKVTTWSDDLDDYSERNAMVTIFKPHGPSAIRRGAIVTNNSAVKYSEGKKYELLNGKNFPNLKYYDEFVPPDEKVTRHGIWIPDRLADQHDNIRARHGWREWTDGVPEEFIKDGKVIRGFRSLGMYEPSRHTITFYARTTASADVADYRQNYLLDTGNIATDNTVTWNQVNTYFVKAADAQPIASWTTATGNPNTADWPSGDYRWFFVIDTLTFSGTNDTIDLSIRRVASDGTTVSETLTTDSSITAAGTHSVTVNTDPGYSAGDRYKVTVIGNTGGSHGNPELIWNVDDTDDYVDGPWTEIVSTRRIFTIS